MRDDVFVYISGPITAKNGHTVEENVASGLRLFLTLIEKGIPAFSPQLSGAFPSAFDVPYETWLKYDYAVIKRCTHMLMMERWQESQGAMLEAAYAVRIGIPIAYSIEELEQLLSVAKRDPSENPIRTSGWQEFET